jgi:hypothetical protein
MDIPGEELLVQRFPKEALNKGGPALLADLNLIRETTSHDFSA